MPGPSSPKGTAKKQKAKDKARIKNRNVKKDYVPAESSLVHQLPRTLTPAMRTWWDLFGGSGKEFEARKGNRGNQNGAMAWIRDKYVNEWWQEHFPQATEVSEQD